MKIENLLRHLKPPCEKCPYKLGLVHTLVNPCPQCKGKGYHTYDRFKKQLLGEALIKK